MSKLESLGKFLILTEGCAPEVVEEVLRMLDRVGAKWNGDTNVYDAEWTVRRTLEQKVSVKVIACGSGFELGFSEERFYRENPEYCGGTFLSAEYFLFLVEDHLYEQA